MPRGANASHKLAEGGREVPWSAIGWPTVPNGDCLIATRAHEFDGLAGELLEREGACLELQMARLDAASGLGEGRHQSVGDGLGPAAWEGPTDRVPGQRQQVPLLLSVRRPPMPRRAALRGSSFGHT